MEAITLSATQLLENLVNLEKITKKIFIAYQKDCDRALLLLLPVVDESINSYLLDKRTDFFEKKYIFSADLLEIEQKILSIDVSQKDIETQISFAVFVNKIQKIQEPTRFEEIEKNIEDTILLTKEIEGSLFLKSLIYNDLKELLNMIALCKEAKSWAGIDKVREKIEEILYLSLGQIQEKQLVFSRFFLETENDLEEFKKKQNINEQELTQSKVLMFSFEKDQNLLLKAIQPNEKVIKPGQYAVASKYLSEFTKNSDEIIVVDRYIFASQGKIDLCKTLHTSTTKKVHFIFEKKQMDTVFHSNITNDMATNGCQYTDYDTRKLHDRFWIKNRQESLIVGTSFNGLGINFTTIIKPSEATTTAIIAYLKEIKAI